MASCGKIQTELNLCKNQLLNANTQFNECGLQKTEAEKMLHQQLQQQQKDLVNPVALVAIGCVASRLVAGGLGLMAKGSRAIAL